MLTIKTSLRESPIHGIGLYAECDIKKGDVVWKFKPGFDSKVSMIRVNSLPDVEREAILQFGYINPAYRNGLVMCADSARFMNFACPSNTELGEPVICDEVSLVAARDIKKGEELTVPLNSDADARRKLGLLKMPKLEQDHFVLNEVWSK